MRYLIKRNLLLFFRDKASVFFSLLGVFIIIGLYLLFLGDVMKSSFSEIPGAGFLADSWIMAGVIAVAPVTTALGAFGILIEDKRLKIYKDFSASPVKRSYLASGYIISSFIISLIMTLVTFILAEGYILINGGEIITGSAAIKVIGIIVINTLFSTFSFYFLVSFFKSSNAYATASTLVGTLVGFLTAIYIPIGTLPAPIQMVVKIFPPSHAAMLLRAVMMEQAEAVSFQNAPSTMIEDFYLQMGVSFHLGDNLIPWWGSILYILCIGILFFALSLWRITKKTS